MSVLTEISLNHSTSDDESHFASHPFYIVNLNIQSICRLNMPRSIIETDG
jgi:hypothetical protein